MSRRARATADGCRRRVADESGVVLIIVAIMLVVLLGAAALAIDVGSFYQAQRQAQSAADAAALAAAQDYGGNTAAITTDATSVATTNFPGSSASVSANAANNQVTVKVTAVSPASFGRFLGINSANVSATAVAQETPAVATTCTNPESTCYAIFSMDPTCSHTGVSFTGGGYDITGGIHSNSSIQTGSGGDTYYYVTYGPTASGCTATIEQYDGFKDGPPQSEPQITTWPIDYALQYPACVGAACTGPGGTPSYCTFASGSTMNFDNTSPPANGNTYCDYGTGNPDNPATWTGSITFDGGSVGTAGSPIEATYIAGTVSTHSGSEYLKADDYPTNHCLIYATASSTSAVVLGGGGNTWTGDIFAPNGTISVTAGGQTTSFLEGQDVSMTAGGITGDGPTYAGSGSSSTGTIALVQ